MYEPKLDEVRQMADQGNLIPIYRLMPADLETPVSVYLKLRQANRSSFLLESVEKGEDKERSCPKCRSNSIRHLKKKKSAPKD